MKGQICKLFATFFYVGDFWVGPGTLASAVGVLIAMIFYGNWPMYLVVTAVITAVGFYVSGPTEEFLNKKDPGCVVIDEVAGVMIAFFMLPPEWPVIWIAFFLFRAFDMFKIWPVNKFEEMHGGVGIMMDDVFAGIYTNLTMQLAILLLNVIK